MECSNPDCDVQGEDLYRCMFAYFDPPRGFKCHKECHKECMGQLDDLVRCLDHTVSLFVVSISFAISCGSFFHGETVSIVVPVFRMEKSKDASTVESGGRLTIFPAVFSI